MLNKDHGVVAAHKNTFCILENAHEVFCKSYAKAVSRQWTSVDQRLGAGVTGCYISPFITLPLFLPPFSVSMNPNAEKIPSINYSN